jgi:lactoylglutathione lyase
MGYMGGLLVGVNFTLKYTGICVKSLDESLDFYLNTLGMELVTRIKNPHTNGEFTHVKSKESEHHIEINWYADKEYQLGDELDHIAFQVADLDEALSYLKSKGFEPVSEIIETEHSRWTYITDPNGIWIEIYQKKK